MARRKQTHQVTKDSEKESKGRAVQKATGRGRTTSVTVPPTPAKPCGERSPSKQSILVERLGRPEGAGIDELTQALGWLPHTVQAALTGLRRKGHAITRAKTEERGSVYRILKRAKGEVLHPAREPRGVLRATLMEMGACSFVAQYQQDPSDSDDSYVSDRMFTEWTCAELEKWVQVDRDNWELDMPHPTWAFRCVPKLAYVHHWLFGGAEPPNRWRHEYELSMEQWERDAILQQQRLLAEVHAPASRETRL